ncbi:UbiA prenyltransferase family protein [Candidatus Woesebacteria bacterium]|nr:UbiA prenyltransferase family protein [Candidatus Woesebacteria bacterium]
MNLFLGFISWLLLCAGIVLYNSYYDKDEQPVAGLAHPPKVTLSLLVGAWIAKILGLLIAISLNAMITFIYFMGIILSVLYSHRRCKLKSYGIVAVIFNFIIGFMTFVVASSFSIIINVPIVLSGSVASGLYLAATYLMMQIHQQARDKERNDCSIVVRYGRRITLTTSLVLVSLAGLFSMLTFILSGLSWQYIALLIMYFTIVLVIGYFWKKHRGKKLSDFKIMNTLTVVSSYAANLILIVMYLKQITKN